MIVGGSFFVIDEADASLLRCSGFCESADLMAARFSVMAPFDPTGYRATHFDDWDDQQVEAVSEYKGCTWYRAMWDGRECIAAVREI